MKKYVFILEDGTELIGYGKNYDEALKYAVTGKTTVNAVEVADFYTVEE